MALLDRLRALPPALVDVLLTVAVLAAQLAPFTSADPEWPIALLLPVLAATLPVLLRRRFPFTVMFVVMAAIPFYDIVGNGPNQPIWYGWLVAVYTVAYQSPSSHRLVTIVVTAVGTLMQSVSVDTYVRGLATWVAAYALGRVAALTKQQSLALRERAMRLERERELAAERAAQHERARIARDMHDILAHAVSLMVVQAESGPLAVRTRPERAEAAFDAIAASGRDAMGQLRRMLGLLKEPEGSRDPQPTLDRIPELVGRVAQATLTETGTPLPLSHDVEVAAYRIIQESLTNVVKHAGAGAAEVRLVWEQDALRVTVTDDGRGPRQGQVGGQGLIGIRERATACGGDASFGLAPSGRGFQVSVRLPRGHAEVAG
ncbi:sensor histidine kinase [Nonomuraea turkmeniaca]|uniref:histidine kinase n=1 Tax=Nonomuraea turkmeniaca TaxID=103838 RepID=A0A5S4FQU6_9ACTN|nr:histidine kinase [Nonomuraea turkmeniaca]TMR22561.1 sensor histidine kinase [Nonomuraea turkmeniaca]